MTSSPIARSVPRNPVPARAGIGFRFANAREILATRPAIGWFEVHAENHMADGGPGFALLEDLRRDYPVSVHGVGLSLGGAEALDERHLDRLARLVERIEPGLVSEHLAWCRHDGEYLPDLLPLPHTGEALETVARHVERVQERLGRQILIENPSRYLAFADEDMDESTFLAALVGRTGCGLLLDVNNMHVSAVNLGGDPLALLRDLDPASIHEIHLAGHHRRMVDGRPLLIDDHGSPVATAVWELYESTLARTGPRPTLIEWDTDIPPLDVLLAEAAAADSRLGACAGREPKHVCAG